MKKHSRIRPLVSSVILPLLAAAVLLFFLTALGNLGDGQRSEGKAQLEAALHRAAVACYACEGIYPPSLDYLKEHYAVHWDPAHYVVDYEIIGTNRMPIITVIPLHP